MTTIAIDFTREILVMDTLATLETEMSGRIEYPDWCKTWSTETKRDDLYYAGSGVVGTLEKFRLSLLEGKPNQKLLKDGSCFWVIETIPELTVTSYYGKHKEVTKKSDGRKVVSTGSGSAFFIGAWAACEDPYKAMEAAKRVDLNTGGDTITVDLSGRSFKEDIF